MKCQMNISVDVKLKVYLEQNKISPSKLFSDTVSMMIEKKVTDGDNPKTIKLIEQEIEKIKTNKLLLDNKELNLSRTLDELQVVEEERLKVIVDKQTKISTLLDNLTCRCIYCYEELGENKKDFTTVDDKQYFVHSNCLLEATENYKNTIKNLKGILSGDNKLILKKLNSISGDSVE